MDLQGAVSEVASVEAGSQYGRTPRSVYISPFSPAMTRGGGGGSTFSFYSGDRLTSCSPAYSLPTFSPLTGRLQYSFVPGSCFSYDFGRAQWSRAVGGRLQSFRQSGSLVSVGSYLMSLGGLDQAGQPLNTVELFDPRRPGIGWREVAKWRARRSVSEACSVVTRDPRLGPQVGHNTPQSPGGGRWPRCWRPGSSTPALPSLSTAGPEWWSVGERR